MMFAGSARMALMSNVVVVFAVIVMSPRPRGCGRPSLVVPRVRGGVGGHRMAFLARLRHPVQQLLLFGIGPDPRGGPRLRRFDRRRFGFRLRGRLALQGPILHRIPEQENGAVIDHAEDLLLRKAVVLRRREELLLL